MSLSSKFFLADGSALYDNYGQNGAQIAQESTAHAAAVAAAVVFPKSQALRTLESDGTSRRNVPTPATHSVPALAPTVPAVSLSHTPAEASSTPVSKEEKTAEKVETATDKEESAGEASGSAQRSQSVPARRSAGLESAPVSAELTIRGNGKQQGPPAVEYEVKPFDGVGVPRTSIGAGHPRGQIAGLVEKRFRGDRTDLSPLLPCTIPPHTHVMNREDGDQYHRTSVYVASGLPMDMPSYCSPRSWKERSQFQRP